MIKALNSIFSIAFSFFFLGVVMFMALTDHFESKKTKTHISILAQRNAVPISEPNQYFKESPAATNLAQITVTNSTFPVVGDTLKVACDYNPPGAINAIFTPPGGNQVWNLSNLQVESSQNIVFQPPSAGTAAASVPGADLLTFGSPHPEEYFNVTSNVMESMGYFDKVLGFSGGTELVANTLFNYTPPIAERHAPLQFFDIYSSTSNSLEAFAPLDLDSSFQTSMLGLVPTLDSMRFRETHQRLDVVDAWGSMTIPGGTYDVLRVKRTEYRSRAIDVKVVPLGWIDISTIGGQQLFSLGTDTLTSFLFVNDQVKEYIAVADLNTSQNTVLKVTFRNSAPLSIPTCNPDSIPPIITCKNQVTPVQCSNQVNFIEAMAFDLCDSSVLITAKNDTIEGTCVGKFSVLRTWTATDGSGNASSCFRMVVVSDTIPPEITCRQIDTVECAKEIPTCSPDGLTSSMDNCDNQLTISCKDSPLALGCNVSFVRTYSAYDDCDNVGTCSITITVANNMPSSITCPENDTIRSCDEAEIAEAFDLWLNSAMASGCGNNVVTNDNVGPPPIAGGTVTVTFKNSTACDTVTCEASFTVAPLESAIELLTNDTICEGAGDTVKIKLSTTNGKAPFDFFFNDIITGSTDCSPVASGGTYIVMDTSMLTLCIANLRAGTYTLTLDSVADMNGCYDATNRSVTITILPKPVSKDGAKLIESCVQAGYNLADSIECNVPSTFIWYAVQAVGSNIPYNNPDVSGETVDPPGTDSIISDVLSNYSNIDQTIVYYVLPTSMDGCRGDSFYVSVTVQPAIINLVANDQVNITMDENCMKVISASDVIKNGGSCAELLTDITLSYPLGTNTYSPANKLDRSHLGYCMIFSVTDKITGNKTWGKLCVEDKAPPMINCRDTTITCFDLANFPKDGDEVPDNCGNPVKVKVAEESFEDYGCNGDPLLLGVVTRRLIATDQWGNSIDCTRKLYIAKTSLDSVLCPRDTSVDCSIAIIPVTLKDKSIILVPITDPSRSHAPQVKTMNGLVDIWPNNPSCKLTVHYTDEKVIICGGGYKVRRDWLITDWCTGIEKHCYQWIVVEDKTAPIARDTTLPVVYSDPHDCGRYVDIDTLPVMDCSRVKQNYSIRYSEEGGNRIIEGVLPVKHIWLPTGVDTIRVFLVDACFNTSKAFIRIPIVDNTPPTPVCDEFTQVTVDPEGCWSKVAAKDLDNGSRDNCCSVLHFAAAKMDSIEYWRNYWNTRLEAAAGKESFWKDKAIYDILIEDWINCYVFSDTVHFDECGSNQVVLRVYEACGVPRYDPHVFPCSEHAWFCYNTYNYIGDFNYNWFDAKGEKSCSYRPALSTIGKLDTLYTAYLSNGYFEPKYAGAAQYEFCNVPFYFPHLITACDNIGNINKIAPGGYCSQRLYADCMVNVLVDDKKSPEIRGLEDITIYCDGAPGWADYPRSCDNGYKDGKWPGYIVDGAGSKLDANGYIYGYYGGSEFLGIHPNSNDHDDPQACASAAGWAPIYCRAWLLIDSFDKAGHVNAADYFFTYKFKDKKLNQVDGKDQFTIFDNCHLDTTSLVVTNSGTINGCGEGWISRTWSIKDKCGNTTSATQKIYVKHRSDFEVIFPEDKIVTCDFLNRTDTSRMGAGSPIITDDECEQIGVRYNDEIFTVEDGACYKIVRTWTLIDWCIYLPTGQAGDPNQHNHNPDVIVNDSLRANKTDRSCVYRNIKDNNDGYMQYVQIIKVIDEIPPVVTCEDYTICIDKDCSVLVNIPLTGTDNCADQVVFRIDITRPDKTHDIRSNVTAIAGTFTEGIYKVQIIGKDRCGNEDTCNMNLTIKDCKKPTPYCLDALATVIMPSKGTVEIWAKDFNRASTDNCTAEADLKYSFNSDVTKASQVITCADMTVDGRIQLITLDVYVTDKAGNQDLCRISIQVQDNGSASQPQGACKDTSASLGNLRGQLMTEELEGVEKAIVEIKDGSNAIPAFKSGIDGGYQFGAIPINGSYTIKALRDDEPMNGVSTLDLVNIQKHILGIERLKSPYKMIAADVNNDNDISAIDLLELRKLILGIYDKLPDNTSWKFVPKSYVFNDINNPWSYPTEESLTHMENNMVKDFVGIKIGDVNASAIPHSLMGTEIRSSEKGLIFEVEDRTFKAGEQVSVEFRSPNFAGISGFQGTINFTDDNLRFDHLGAVPSIEKSSSLNSKLNITDKNIGKRWANEGQITMSWNSDKSLDVDSRSVLFTMTFTATRPGRLSEVLRIGSQHTIAESYEGKGELGTLSIRFVKNGKEIAGTNTLYQNYPNPFDQRTVIGINLAQATSGQLKITDVTGRAITSIDRDWNKGYNEVWLDRREIGATGVLYYSFESSGFNAVKKMVIID